MARRNVPVSENLPYHITARCINREWFGQPLPIVWSIMEDYLRFIYVAYNVRIISFVLMPNHFHLIAVFPNKNLGAAMNYFMRETSRQINARTGRINQTYGARFHRTLIQTAHYFHHAYKYVYRNPVKANLCTNVEDYRFSTLNGLIGKSQLNIPVEEDTLLFSSPTCGATLLWLNRTPSEENQLATKRALRRTVFELPRNKNNKVPSPLEIHDF